MTSRLTYFDQMKGIAIILVVIGHVMQFSYGYNPSEVVKMLSIFHMPIFFYVSGYFMSKMVPGGKDMLKKLCRRSTNLLVPYLIFAGLWCAFSGDSYTDLLLKGGGRYWFLWVLFLISVFFIVYGYILQKVKREWLYILLWLIPYGAIIAGKLFVSTTGGGDLLCINELNTYYRYFLIGYLSRRYIKFNSLLFKNNIVYAIGFIVYFLQWRYCDMHNMALIFLGGMGAIIVLQRYFEIKQGSDSKVLKLLSRIGQASLPIYVMHYFFIPDVSNIMHTFLDAKNPFIWQLSFAFLLAIPIIAACMFIGKLIDNNKYLNFAFMGKTL